MTPWKWFGGVIALALLIVSISAFVSWIDARGYKRASVECKAEDLQQTVDASNTRIAELETALAVSKSAAQDAADREQKLQEQIQNGRKEIETLNAGLRSGAIRLRDKFTCAAAKPDSNSAAGQTPEARAGFDESDAEAAFAIAGDGDEAIRELNACIDQLNADRETLAKRHER
ncbi:lysis system i-spanin subunit Rz [Hydrocarboniphaga effusa]|uniref:lysis system i-spanin subunit Rz n=1 Tax=Hydrocarboniphaga effusa TaxID=243629 RepID=UPI00398BF994